LFWKESALWLEKQESAKVRKQNRRAGRRPLGERDPRGAWRWCGPSTAEAASERGPHHSWPRGAERLSGGERVGQRPLREEGSEPSSPPSSW
jgi:hypothetical protein